MDKQSRLLEKDYLTIRLQELKEIRRKEIKFTFEHSNRPNSITIYVQFWTKGTEKDFWVKNHTLRISDHVCSTSPHTQFIIEPNEDLTKKKKEQFRKVLLNCMKKTLYKEFCGKMNTNSRRCEENDLQHQF